MSPLLTAQIANLALNTFSSLPPKCKPRTLPTGATEWTPLSAILLSKSLPPTSDSSHHHSDQTQMNMKIVSLATGTKSLPISSLPKCNGLILHDCHAEILALRGFNYWVLCEVERILSDEGYVSEWLEFALACKEDAGKGNSAMPPLMLNPDVEISMFTTEAPCGDASMELLIAAAEARGMDVTPWPTSIKSSSSLDSEAIDLPSGRGGFSDLGVLRRKPARADAEISMSKSCTDKIMLKQFTSLLGFPAEVFLQSTKEAYMRRVVTYQDQYCEEGYRRAFGEQGRFAKVLPALQETGSVPRFFGVEVLPSDFRRFDYEKPGGIAQETKGKVSNVSALWIAGPGLKKDDDVVEVLVNGVKQGYKQFDGRERKGSTICRKNMIRKAAEVMRRLQHIGIQMPCFQDMASLLSCSYSQLKSLPYRGHKRKVKRLVLEGLGGWPAKTVEDDFEFDLPCACPISNSGVSCLSSSLGNT